MLYSPRQRLLLDGISLARSQFPFGTGWGTFASTMASKDYSPLYYGLGYDSMYGLQPLYTSSVNFLNDNWFASVVGQLGFFGLAVFIYLIYYILKLVISRIQNENIDSYLLAGMVGIISIIFASGFFTSSSGAFLMGMLGIIFASRQNGLGS